MFIRTLIISTSLLAFTPAIAQDMQGHDMSDMQNMKGDMAEHMASDAHKMEADITPAEKANATLVTTPELTKALDAGGTPLVVDVLGVVCDFCAKAMNKTFGKREEVAAAYVDLDTKTLNLMLKQGASLDDETIHSLVKKAGYKVSAIHRDVTVEGGAL